MTPSKQVTLNKIHCGRTPLISYICCILLAVSKVARDSDVHLRLKDCQFYFKLKLSTVIMFSSVQFTYSYYSKWNSAAFVWNTDGSSGSPFLTVGLHHVFIPSSVIFSCLHVTCTHSRCFFLLFGFGDKWISVSVAINIMLIIWWSNPVPIAL